MKVRLSILIILKEDVMEKLFGVTTAMVTPMNEKGEVNYKELERLTEFLIDKGVNCLYPLGTTGEMFKLNVNERKKVAETVVNTAQKRVKVFIHIGAMTLDDTLLLANHAVSIGATGIGAVTPVFFPADDVQIEAYYQAIAEEVPDNFPIYLYSIPQLASNALSLEVVKRLAANHQNIVGIKYSYPDFLTLKDYLSVRNNSFSVLTGSDSLFLPALAMGCDGVVSGVSCVFPEPFKEIYKLYSQGELAQARNVQQHADNIIQILKGGSNLSYFKKGLELRGIQGGSVKRPQLDLTIEEEKALIENINSWKRKLSLVELLE
jgi:4-hydroxy-tetrahydrodipicolinate synthase